VRKRSLPRLAAASAAVALLASACGSGESSAEAEGGPVKLTMYYPVAVGGPLTEVVDGLISDFEAEHQDITVEAVYSGSYADTMTKVQTAARGGDAPDLAVLLSTELYTLLDDELIVSFDDLTGGKDDEWLNSFYEPFMANGKDGDGTVWSVPFQRSTIVQYWNKDVFAEAGLDPEKPPTTWDELTSMSQKIVDSGAAEYGIEIPTTQFGYWMLQALAIQNDTLLQNDSGTETNFDDPGAIEALEYWISLGESGVAPKGTVEWASTPEDFLQGRTAMMWTSTGNLSNVKKNAGFEFGVSMLPEKVRPGSPTGGGNLYVFESASDAEREAALELIKWLTAPEQTARWSIATGYVATSPEAWETEEMKQYVNEFPPAAVARDQLEYAVPELSTHENGRIVQLLNDAIAAAMVGQESAEDAMTGAQEQADQLLKRYR
jgi:sn-glycerol 3-phosphate transport system substrate-binding protein